MTVPTTLALPETLFDELLSWLALEVETAGVLFLSSGDEGRLLLARELRSVPDKAYRERGALRLDIASGGYVPALKLAADRGEIACFVHSHPRGRPYPSNLDDGVDAELRRFFPARTGQPSYVSLIVGGTPETPELAARYYRGEGDPIQIERFRVVGRRIRLFMSGREESPAASFDRQVRAFGRDGQLILRQMRVGVVGAGGTGSAVAEQLIRLGVGEIVLADPDVVSLTNLTRIHQSAGADVGAAKVAVAARLAEELSQGTRVTRIEGKLTEETVARAFAGLDVIFGCTDDHAGRAVLSRLAWYLMPAIDMGVVIDSAAGEIRGLFVRVTNVGPGYPCLVCRDVVDPIRIRDELLQPDERAVRVAEGYVPGLADPDPSVVTYTTLAGSLAVSELLARLFDLGDEAPGELLFRVHDRKLGARAAQSRPGHYCADPKSWGIGDEKPFLGQTW